MVIVVAAAAAGLEVRSELGLSGLRRGGREFLVGLEVFDVVGDCDLQADRAWNVELVLNETVCQKKIYLDLSMIWIDSAHE